MLTINIPDMRFYDEDRNEFVMIKAQTLNLEHSLISLQKWEQKWKIPYLRKETKTTEQTIDYIKCMAINKVDDDVYYALTDEMMNEIIKYIDDQKTAFVFKEERKEGQGVVSSNITAETIYYWMINLGIPIEFRKWHLSSLLALIKYMTMKTQKPKKMSAADRRALNLQRRAKHHTKG